MLIQSDLYQRAINAYGRDHQIGVAHEELGELITALSRFESRKRGEVDEVLSEIADGIIVLSQLVLIYGTEDVKKMMYKKLQKLRNHVEHKEKENENNEA